MASIDNFLNTAIPFVLLFAGIVFIWYKFNEPFKKFFEWITGFFAGGAEKTIQASKEIVYDI